MEGIGVISTVGIGFLEEHPENIYKKWHIDAIKNEIRKARKLNTGILGVNIMSVITSFSDLVKTSI
jgi:nitronate monooxygenase